MKCMDALTKFRVEAQLQTLGQNRAALLCFFRIPVWDTGDNLIAIVLQYPGFVERETDARKHLVEAPLSPVVHHYQVFKT